MSKDKIGASPECPSRSQAVAARLADQLRALGKIQDDPEWWEHRDLCNSAAAEIVRLQTEVDRLTVEADGEYVRAACRVMRANPGFDARDYDDGITADEFEAFFSEDMAEAWRQRATPLVPTEAMLVAARDWSDAKYGKPIGNDAATGCWQAMLRASPASCDGSAEGGETGTGLTEGNSAVGEAEAPTHTPQQSPSPSDPEAKPCHWGGGNDIIWCSTCGAEYAYAKGQERPACPRASPSHPEMTVEEARTVLDRIPKRPGAAEEWIAHYRGRATELQAKSDRIAVDVDYFADFANSIEAAIRILQDSGEQA